MSPHRFVGATRNLSSSRRNAGHFGFFHSL
jgi:hypothetical protein